MFSRQWAWLGRLTMAGCVAAAATHTAAQEEAGALAEQRLKEMRARIETITTAVRGQDRSTSAELRSEPVFRYSDNVRHFADASAWLWQASGRPVAFCKLERLAGAMGWQYCFVSLSDQLITANWSDRLEWQARKAGIVWSPVPQAREPQATQSGRLSQMRLIARQFEGTITNVPSNRSEKMRLLPTPLVRYASEEDGVLDGALFGLTSKGTNPDALLLVEAVRSDGKDEWRYGFQGATGDRVEMRLADAVVWSKSDTEGPGDHENWMWTVLYDDGAAVP
jgi:hypothetical protein